MDNKRYLSMFEMVNDAIILINAQGYTIVYMNDKARELYGYVDEDITSLDALYLCHDVTPALKRHDYAKNHPESGFTAIEHHKHKSGNILSVEVNTKYISFEDHALLVSIVREMSGQIKLQEDVLLASKLQQQTLPAEMDHHLVLIKSIYQPLSHISGDYFDYTWITPHKLFGYILDVKGHGMTAALQIAAVRVLWSQIVQSNIKLALRMQWLNKQIQNFFTNSSHFLGFLCFEIDFPAMQLTWSAGGINKFLLLQKNNFEMIQSPGIFLGILENAEFDIHTKELSPGDNIFFMSDGLTDLIDKSGCFHCKDFDMIVHSLNQLAISDQCLDDATAVCIKIK